MATLSQARSDVYAGLTSGVANPDLRIPPPLIDFWVITAALAEMQELTRRNGVGRFIAEPWMYSVFSCLPIEEKDWPCTEDEKRLNDYVTILPFIPVSLPGDAGLLSVQIQNFGKNIPIVPYHIARSGSKIRFATGEKEDPVAFRNGKYLYLRSCGRDLSVGKLEVLGIALELLDDSAICPYENDRNLPLMDSLVPMMIEKVVKKGLMYLGMNQADLAEDGVPKNIASK